MSRNGSRKSQQKKRENVRLLKLITLGDRLCGKSCFIKRFCEKKFENKYLPTIGVDYGVKKINSGSHTLSLNIFDTSGDPVYASLRREFYDNTNVRMGILGLRNCVSQGFMCVIKVQYHCSYSTFSSLWDIGFDNSFKFWIWWIFRMRVGTKQRSVFYFSTRRTRTRYSVSIVLKKNLISSWDSNSIKYFFIFI